MPVSAIPIWLVGRNTSSCTSTPQSADSSGTLSPQTALPLVGFVDEIEYSGTQNAQNLVNMTAVRENMVAVEIDGTLTLTEILQSKSGLPSGNNGNLLAEAWASGYDYAQVVIARGGNTWTFVGVMQGYVETITKGRCTGRMTLQPVNLGNAVNSNPAFS